MLLTVCSVSEVLPDEQQLVSELFRAGLNTFHLRKPTFSAVELRHWLEQLTQAEQQKVVLHSHWMLAQEFQLKGIHIGASTWKTLTIAEQSAWLSYARRKQLTISSSVHDQEELDLLPLALDYVWLSPVFESISKQGYRSDYNSLQFNEWVMALHEKKQTKAFALGGITAKHIAGLGRRGFDGVVVLGAVWENIKGIDDQKTITERINQLIASCKTESTS